MVDNNIEWESVVKEIKAVDPKNKQVHNIT
jgi:hypothetical protein